MPNNPQSDAAYDAEIDAILADLEEQIQVVPTEADIKAEAEAEVADLCHVLDSL